MSYSFNVKAANKVDAKTAVAAEFDKVVIAIQPVHAHDRAAALANANAAIDLLAEKEGKDISVSVNGFLSWSNKESIPEFNSVGISSSAGYVDRVPA